MLAAVKAASDSQAAARTRFADERWLVKLSDGGHEHSLAVRPASPDSLDCLGGATSAVSWATPSRSSIHGGRRQELRKNAIAEQPPPRGQSYALVVPTPRILIITRSPDALGFRPFQET